MKWSTSIVLVVLASAASGSEMAPSIFIHAGRILDVGDGTYRSDVLLTIERGRILAIEDASRSPLPKQVVDLSRSTVLPGLMDAHVHLCDESWRGNDWAWWETPLPGFGILGARNAETLLRAGFTTVRDTGDHFYCGVSVRNAIEAGRIPGPRVLAAGPYVTMTGGHGYIGNWMAPHHEMTSRGAGQADGIDEVRHVVRDQLRHRLDLVKIMATGGFGTAGTVPGASSYSIEEIAVAVEEATKRGVPVAAHAHGADGIRNAVAAGVRSIEHGVLLDDDAIRVMAEKRVYLVPDLLAAHWDLIDANKDYSDKELESSNEEEYLAYADRVLRAHQGGVPIAFGTDSGVYPHGDNARQFSLLVDAGFTPLEAIRTATTVAAELFGLADEIGRIEVGRSADLVAVAGDPLEDIRVLENVHWVMKQGEIFAVPRSADLPAIEIGQPESSNK